MPERLRLEITVDDKGSVVVKRFGGETKRAFAQVEASAKKTRLSFESLAKAAIGVFAVTRVKAWVTDWVREAGRQEQATAGMEQALRSMGRYTPELRDQLLDLAGALQETTTFGDEAIIQGEKFLLTYKDITDDLLPRTTKVMLDLAALMGGDTVRAANMLGKASMGLTGELRRAGITVDQDTYKAKGFIGVLEQIEQQVRGQAEALAATGYGGLQQLANLWGDAKEDLGELVLVLTREFYPTLRVGISLISEMAEYWGAFLNPPSGVELLQQRRREILDELMTLQAELKGFEPDFRERVKKLYDPLYTNPDRAKMEARIKVLQGMLKNINRQLKEETKPRKPPGPAPTAPPTEVVGLGAPDLGEIEEYFRQLQFEGENAWAAYQEAHHMAYTTMREDLGRFGEEVDTVWTDMVDLSRRTAEAMEQNFSDLFFDFMTGELKTLGDYADAVFRSMSRAASDFLGQLAFRGMMGAVQNMGWNIQWPAKGYQSGGIIPEPVVGVGKSGRTYTFAERGPERVSPAAGKPAPAITITNNITVQAPEGRISRQSLNQLQTALGLSLQRALGRNG